MKHFLLIIVASVSSLGGLAHGYHFAFAELNYNLESKKIEASISVSTHDFEHSLTQKGIKINHLESYYQDEMMQKILVSNVLENFKVNIDATQCDFKFIGYEVLNSGTTNFYFESQIVELKPLVSIQFDLMMDEHTEQQNKLIFIYPEGKQTLVFLSSLRKQQLTLEKEHK